MLPTLLALAAPQLGGCSTILPDAFEPNDDVANPTLLTDGLHALTLDKMDPGGVDDVDVLRIDVPPYHDATVNVAAVSVSSQPDLVRFRFGYPWSSTSLDVATLEPGETASWSFASSGIETARQVIVQAPTGACAEYTIELTLTPRDCASLPPDPWEAPWQCGSALPMLAPGRIDGATLGPDDTDRYELMLSAAPGQPTFVVVRLTVTMGTPWPYVLGGLEDICGARESSFVEQPDGSFVATLARPPGSNAPITVELHGPSLPGEEWCCVYSLEYEEDPTPAGQPYCAGSVFELTAWGSTDVLDDDLWLSLNTVTHSSLGVVQGVLAYASLEPANRPTAVGTICIGPTGFRRLAPPLAPAPNSTLQFAFPVPVTSGPLASIAASGTTVYLQAVKMGGFFNPLTLTTAVAVTFD